MGLRLRTPGVVAAWGVAALLLAGCGGKKPADASPTTSSSLAAPVETTSTTVGVDQVPAVITVEYAQRVMDALDKLEGDLTRLLVANKVPNQQFRQMLTALYDEPAFSQAEASFGRDAAAGNDVYVANPGNPLTRIKELLDSSPTCMVLDATRDLSPQLKTPVASEKQSTVIVLAQKKADRDTLHANNTPWAIVGAGAPAPGANLRSGCH